MTEGRRQHRTAAPRPRVVLAIVPLLVRAPLAAVMLGLSSRSFRRLCSAGAVPASTKLLGVSVWSLEELRAWSAAGCPGRQRWAALRASPAGRVGQ